MKTQFFTFLSFVLSFAVLGEVKVQKAPLKSLLIDNASVVTDVTGTDAAKRLEADGGKSWIDGDGRVYRVERRASFRGLSAFSADDPSAGPVNWSFDYPGAEYCDLSYDPPSRWYLSYGRMEDVENDGVIWQEEVQYVYEGTAPWSASSVTMKREHYNEEFVLSLAFVTNAADRLATTGEVARIASGISGGLTTNDVCAIVTNEVEKWSEWEWSDGKVHKDPEYLADLEEPKWMMDYAEAWAYGIGELADGDADSTRLVFGEFDNTGFLLIATRRWIKGANALGLAMAKDVEKKFAEATNAIPSIVTNEVAGGWTITADNPDISLDGWYVELGYVMQMPAMIRHPRWYIKCDGWTYLKTNAFLEDATVLESEAERAIDSNKNGVFDEGEEIITFNVRAEKVSRNALGLARMKDIEGVPTSETVTNIVRKVVNTAGKYLWDAKDEVCWRVNMSGGFVDLVAVTNIDLTLPENHLALEAIENEWRAK